MRIVIPSIRTESMTLMAEEQVIKISGRLDMQFPKQTLGIFLNNLRLGISLLSGEYRRGGNGRRNGNTSSTRRQLRRRRGHGSRL